MGFQKRNLSCALVIFGVVHPWVGQKLLICDVFKSLFARQRFSRSGDARPLSEATADLS